MEMIKVLMIDLPHTVRGLTVYYFDDDGQAYYTILINSRLSAEMQCEAYDHEISHINNGDFDSMQEVDRIEYYRHSMAI